MICKTKSVVLCECAIVALQTHENFQTVIDCCFIITIVSKIGSGDSWKISDIYLVFTNLFTENYESISTCHCLFKKLLDCINPLSSYIQHMNQDYYEYENV